WRECTAYSLRQREPCKKFCVPDFYCFRLSAYVIRRPFLPYWFRKFVFRKGLQKKESSWCGINSGHVTALQRAPYTRSVSGASLVTDGGVITSNIGEGN